MIKNLFFHHQSAWVLLAYEVLKETVCGSWQFAGEVVMEASEEKWKFMRVRGREGGSIPLSRVMDTNFFISPSLIIKQPRPPIFLILLQILPATQYKWEKKKNISQWKEGRRAHYTVDLAGTTMTSCINNQNARYNAIFAAQTDKRTTSDLNH